MLYSPSPSFLGEVSSEHTKKVMNGSASFEVSKMSPQGYVQVNFLTLEDLEDMASTFPQFLLTLIMAVASSSVTQMDSLYAVCVLCMCCMCCMCCGLTLKPQSRIMHLDYEEKALKNLKKGQTPFSFFKVLHD